MTDREHLAHPIADGGHGFGDHALTDPQGYSRSHAEDHLAWLDWPGALTHTHDPADPASFLPALSNEEADP